MDGWVKRAIRELQDYVRLVGQVGRAAVTPPIYWRDIVDQLDAIGVGSLTVVLLTGVFTGAVLALQSGFTLDQFGARTVVGRLVSASMVKELGPVLTALMVTGRVGSGIAAELGSMAATEQIDAVRALGADPIKKLVAPRVAATLVVLPVLVVFGDVVGVLAGLVVARFEFGVPARFYLVAVRDFLVLADFASGILKAAVFGLAAALIGCRAGLGAAGGTAGVGRATTGAVVTSSLAVVVLDYLLTRMFFVAEVVR